jgi:predicted metal-dependent hydrolase
MCLTDFFLTLLSENIIHDIVSQSNLYIQQKQRHIQPIMEQEDKKEETGIFSQQ